MQEGAGGAIVASALKAKMEIPDLERFTKEGTNLDRPLSFAKNKNMLIRKKALWRIVGLSLGLLLLFGCRKGEDSPRNIILMIADGCGYSCVEAASLYQFGESDAQVYQKFPVQAAVSTFSLDTEGYDPRKAWSDFDYVTRDPTDSASAATAFATGYKTRNRFVGVNAYRIRLKTVCEQAKKKGKAAGTVTSVPFSHATPAGFWAHHPRRNDYHRIGDQLLFESRADVIMGCGHPDFDDEGNRLVEPNYRYISGEENWRRLRNPHLGISPGDEVSSQPWFLVDERADFQALAEGPVPPRIFGLAPAHSTLQQNRGGDGFAAPFVVPANENLPTLVEMTRAALNVLDDDPQGFFLMVEGGAVDWAAEDNQSGRLIEEMVDFNRSVEAVSDWIESHGGWEESLLIVTSDHETGGITGPAEDGRNIPVEFSGGLLRPLINNGRGNLPGMEWRVDYHTNMLVPLFACGRASERLRARAVRVDPVYGRYLDNTDIARVIFGLLD